ncbi:hypothetical protein [Flavobacterium kingsejongi]|uniref:Uncharacterized protein n=1 Tax=Flavobacterium kingsejongi TaxID=1678728 RepID=A0A2S1LQK4_9FLAO|nr:hypothetical protein [Flavobacterium kingsejongi]AWG26040.1 hypothetical protein FK004_12800 [Flavobacterium kingsejongi]
MKDRKQYILIGALIFIVGIIAMFPLEVLMNSNNIGKLTLSFSGLSIGLLVLLYGFMGRSFLKAVGIILAGVLISMLFWYVYENGEWGDSIIIFWVGVPAGILGSILFLIVNHYFLCGKNNKTAIGIQVLWGLLILAAVNALYYNFGDLMDSIL